MANDTRTLRVVVTGDSTGGQRALGDVGKKADDTQSRIGNLAKGMGSFAVKGGGALLAVAGAAGTLGVKTAAGFQTAHVGFTTMLGSSKKADAFISDMAKFAAETPFAFPDLVMASQRMLAMGFAAKDVKPTLTAVGDAVAAMGGGKEQIDQVTMALGQMQAKGKVQGDELLQLTEAGIPALKILASTYGVTSGEMQKMITKGQVLSKDAIPKLVKGIREGTKETKAFGGMMKAQSATLVGQWSQLQDTVTTGLGKVMAPFIPMMTKATGSVNKFLAGGLAKLADYTKNVAAPAIQNFTKDWNSLSKGTFGGDLHARITRISAAIQGFFAGLKSGGGSSEARASMDSLRQSWEKLGPIVAKLRDDIPNYTDVLKVAATAMAFLADHTDELKAALPYLAAGFILVKTAQVGANVAAAVSPALRIAELMATRKLTASNMQLVASMQANTVAATTNVAVENVSRLSRIRATVATVAHTVATKTAAAATKVWTVIQAAFGAVMATSMGPITLIIGAIALLVAGVIYAYKNFGWFKTAVDASWKAIKIATQAVAAWFMSYVWPTLRTAFNYLRAAVTVLFNVWKAQFNIGKAVALAVVGWVRNTAWPIIQTAFNLMRNHVMALWTAWRTAFDLIRSKVETVLNFAKSAFTKAKDSIGNTWAKLQDLAKKPVNFVIETVYNNGIRKFWNAIATKVGAKPLDTIAKLAGGGRGIPSRSDVVGDWVPFYGQAGEYVLNRKQVAKAGGWRGVEQLFGAAGRDGASSGHYDKGGILGGIARAGSWLKDKAGDLVKGSLLTIAQPLINTIKGAIRNIPGTGDIADAVRGLPTKALDSILAWIKPRDKAPVGDGTWNGQIAPGAIGAMQRFALAQKGKTYLWAAAGPSHYDCSGLVGNLWAIATGNKMYRRYMSTANMGAGRHGMVSGPGKFTVYLSRSGGHTAANIGGLHAEAYGGNGTPLAIGRIGTRLSYYNERLHLPGLAGGGTMPDMAERLNSFAQRGWPEPPPGVKVPRGFEPLGWKGVDRAALYDNGGILPPGATLAINKTGRNEYVSTDAPVTHVTVNVTVQGNVTAERDLAESIATAVRDALIRKANRNGGRSGLK